MKKNITFDEATDKVIKGYEDTVTSLTSMDLKAPDITPKEVDNVSRELDAEIDALCGATFTE